MRILLLACLAAFSAAGAFGATYSYSVYNPSDATIGSSDASNFTANGPITVSSGAVTSGTGNGSLILNGTYSGFAALSDKTSYEVSMTIALKQAPGVAGGDFVQYIYASSNAISTPYGYGPDAGTFAAIHLYNPTFGSFRFTRTPAQERASPRCRWVRGV